MAEANHVREVERLFKSAVDLPPPERSDFLDSQCAPDSAVRREVEELLRHFDVAPDTFLSPPWLVPGTAGGPGAGGGPRGAEATDLPRRIGRYRILSKIGEGGMGVVYEAEQEQPRRRVALKVVRPALPLSHLQRFQYESEVLGRLQHPGIAHVYEAGVAVIDYAGGAPARQPFLAMELIDGLPLLEHVEVHGLDTAERLQLLCRICDAVQYAHQRGVIHRDLKPANLLVDHTGQPKVLDFGVARMVLPDGAGAEQRTQAGEMLGTLPYMSPEQLGGDPALIDTRSDVYALGVILYQLLTGTLPFRFPRGTLEEVHQRLAGDRYAPPGSFHPEHRGDLDVITAKALARDREQRYRSPAALAADLRHTLRDEPIEARASSGWYVMWKQMRRHRFPVAIAAAFLVALVVFAAVSWQLFVSAEDARDAAETQRRQATERLWESYRDRARLGRIAHEPGQRIESLRAIRRAAEIRPSMELRNEAIACLALPDLREGRVFAGAAGARSVGLDRIDRFAETIDLRDIRVVATATGEPIAYLPGPGSRPWVYVFSPGGRYLAVKYHGGKGPLQLWVWDVERARTVLRLEPGLFPRTSVAIGWERGVEMSRWVALAQTDGAVHLYALPSGAPLRVIGGRADGAGGASAHAIAVDPQGHRLAVATAAGGTILDVANGHVLLRIPTRARVFGLSWNAEGTLLAGACDDHLVYLWSAGSGRTIRTLAGHESAVTRVGFGPRHLLVSCGWDGTTRLWDSRTGREILGALQERELWGVGARSIGVLDAMDTYTILRFEPSPAMTSLVAEAPCGAPGEGAIAPGGSLLAAAGANGLRLWDLASGQPIADLAAGAVRDVVFNASGESVYAATGDGLLRWRLTPPVAAGMAIAGPERIRQHDGPCTIGWAPDRRALLVCNNHGSMVEVDPRDGRLLAEFPGRYGVESPVVSPDGRWIFTGNWRGEGGRLWDARTREVVREFPGTSVKGAFSPDGSQLMVSTLTGFRALECGSWGERFAIDASERSFTGDIAFAPGGRMVAVTYRRATIRLLDARTGSAIAEFADPDLRSITHLEFTPDGTRLVVMTSDREIRVWHLARVRQELHALGLDWDS